MSDQLRLVDELRKRPYVWVSWITKLLARECRCWYAAWFKAHYSYVKRKDDEDRKDFFAEYTAKHDEIVNRRVAALRADGWTVKVESEGEFKIRGERGDLVGKPDIVAMKGEEALVVDGKSGNPKQSDHWQVVLYEIFLPKSWLKGFAKIRGEVQYRDGVVDVRPVTEKERAAVGEALRRVMGPEPPAPTPSRGDCKFCEVASCASRMESPEGDSGGIF